MLDFETSNSKSEVSKSIRGKLLLLETYSTSEGAVSHNVVYYQPLPITHYHVRLYANIILSNYQCTLPLTPVFHVVSPLVYRYPQASL